MFQSLVVSKSGRGKRPKTALLLSMAVHFLALSALILLPLLFYRTPGMLLAYVTPPPMTMPDVTPAPPPQPASSTPQAPPPRAVFVPSEFLIPQEVPNEIPPPSDQGLAPIRFGDQQPGVPGTAYGTPQIPGQAMAPIQPPQLTPPPVPQEPLRGPTAVGGDLQQSKLIRRVTPPYPDLARRARIEGTVLLRAIIDEEGRVRELQVIKGHRLLQTAAREAVQQWRYSPTLLNGEPVPVITTIQVVFRLQ